MVFHHRVAAGAGDVIVLEFRERSLFFAVMGRYEALQHHFGVGGHFEIDSAALDQAHRLAEVAAGNLELVEAVGGGGRRGSVVERVVADEDRHRHRLVALLVLEIVLPGVTRIEQDARLVRSLDLQAVEADVALAGVGVLAHHQAGPDDRAGVLDSRLVHRQVREVEFSALELPFLNRGIGDHHRRDQLTHPRRHRRHHHVLGGAEGQGRMADIGRSLAQGAPAMGQVLEQQGLLARLIKQRAHLGQGIDRLVDADQFAGRIEIGNPAAHVLGARVRIGRRNHCREHSPESAVAAERPWFIP